MRVNVVSPWYPDYASVYSGIFVKKAVDAVHALGAEVSVEVPLLFPAPAGAIPKAVTDAIRQLASGDSEATYPGDGRATWIPTPVSSGSGYFGRARAFASSLSIKREHIPVSADVHHAHLGLPTGWAVSSLEDSPLVVSEHQSMLADLFREPAAAEAYRDTLERADAFICVSQGLRDQITEQFGPAATEKILIVPNVVDLTDIPYLERTHKTFERWIYVGALASHKGIPLLLQSFAIFHREVSQDATLTLIGDGPLRRWVERFATSKGIRTAIRTLGAMEHSRLGPYLEEADLMVHLSPSETFGIASVEGIGAGLPVVSLRNGGAQDAWGDIEQQCGCILDPDSNAEDVVDAVVGLRRGSHRLNLALGRSEVERRFSPRTVGATLMGIYHELTSR